MIQTDDNIIIARVLNGETAAFEVLVNRYKDMAFSIALRVCKNTEDAEEVAQDAFLKAYQSLSKFKQESKFSTWLYRIVTNTAISSTRKRKIAMVSLDKPIIENYSENEIQNNMNQFDFEEQSRMIKKTMQLLHPQDCLLLNMFYTDNLSIEEIEEITGLTQTNIKVKLHRIRKKLYSLINEQMIKNSIPVIH
ncbi:MAG: sigma-70 family RNA polymerase sigma factor [Bacteroidales bacterium]|jgi:RNA polymerase sigma-70 factor (ECF subfamily)|nr:sigma-70 family RNA polymerase sigma factor [Bacteroidales bacterium]